MSSVCQIKGSFASSLSGNMVLKKLHSYFAPLPPSLGAARLLVFMLNSGFWFSRILQNWGGRVGNGANWNAIKLTVLTESTIFVFNKHSSGLLPMVVSFQNFGKVGSDFFFFFWWRNEFLELLIPPFLLRSHFCITWKTWAKYFIALLLTSFVCSQS